uniref:Uncharacterized protein n=1 Tax=Anopheles coluzzii TaxID=1518534 RepID=A0A8W7PCR1_ANOCL
MAPEPTPASESAPELILNTVSESSRSDSELPPLVTMIRLVPNVLVLGIVGDARVADDQRVLGADVQRVVDLPVDVAHLAGGMEQALQRVLQYLDRAERHPQPLDRVHERLHQMGRRLEDVRPDVVQQMDERVLAPEPVHAERHVLDRGAGRLPVDEVAIHQRVLQQRADGVDVVLAHLADGSSDGMPSADATTANARAVVLRTYSSMLSMSGRIVEIIVASPAAFARFEMISRPSTRA